MHKIILSAVLFSQIAMADCLTVEDQQILRTCKGPIKMISPFPPGAGVEVMTRDIVNLIQKTGNTNIIVENKVGAGGNLASYEVTREDSGNNCKFMLSSNQLMALAALNPQITPQIKLGEDLVPVASVVSTPFLLVVNKKEVKFKDAKDKQQKLAEFMDTFKRGGLNYPSMGVGTVTHMAVERVSRMVGTKDPHTNVPGREDQTQVLANEAGDKFAFTFAPPLNVTKFLDRDIEVIGNTSKSTYTSGRLKEIPSLNTIPALKDFELNATGDVVTSKATNPKVAQVMAKAISCVKKNEAFRKKYEEQGSIITKDETPAELMANAKNAAVAFKEETARVFVDVKKTNKPAGTTSR